jgi:hypothetical protein
MGQGQAIVFGMVVVVAIALVVWSFSRGRTLLNRWAEENRFRIIHAEVRHLCAGPFTWTKSRNQIVYYVRVSDRDGKERKGWVRCGSYFGGLASDKTDVRWEDDA